MRNEFFRLTAGSPRVTVADPEANVDAILELLKEAKADCPDAVVLPELCIPAYTCGDLFHNSTLLEGSRKAFGRLVEECPEGIPLVFAGIPVEYEGALYNCAVAFSRGKVYGIVPKTYIPTYNEFYERRWFAPARSGEYVEVEICAGHRAPMSTDLLFRAGGVCIGAELCEDLWVAVPPSCFLAMNGAEVIVNLSASDDVIGKYAYLKSLISQQSARCVCAYGYASAGYGESTTDLVFDGKCIISENGHLIAEANRYRRGNKFVTADIDVEGLRRERLHLTTFADCGRNATQRKHIVECGETGMRNYMHKDLKRQIDAMPFVPKGDNERNERCDEILHIQESGLCKRLESTGCKRAVIGISGGLDSTLALLVAVRAFDSLGLNRKGIIGITMPGFGTTERTHGNALRLMEKLGITSREIEIGEAVEQHFRDIGHDPSNRDVTYENSQARERTQILMDVANQEGGMVIGTGDLSELALGWATYNGDHMSMYAVNSGVPKTLVRYLVTRMAERLSPEEGKEELLDIAATPISPELIPADAEGNIVQKTEDLVGPYELHDFFLYRMLRHGENPRRIYLLARTAFRGVYDEETIKAWLKVFVKRFFGQQFKRSCLPDGPKVGSVSLSPRGDWRMPSDASAALWLKEVDSL